MLNRFLSSICLVVLFVSNGHTLEPADGSIFKPALAKDGAAGFEAMVSRGYTPLFNGKDLTGWRNPYPHGESTVVDGEIHLLADKKFFLVTEKKYSDFRLSVEIHLPEGKANSGVMFRCHVDEDAKKKKVFGYQAECDGSERRWSGGFYDEGRRGWIWPSTSGRSEEQFRAHEKESKAAFADPVVAGALNRNGWNRFVITCIQDRITIEVNGVPTVTFRDAADAEGYIGLQHHGEKGQLYRFRNVFIQELPIIPAADNVSLETQSPVSITKIDDKTTLVDFGKVAFGNLVMRVPQGGRGVAKIHFGEKLKDGRIDRNPPGTVRYGVSEYRNGSGERGNWIVPTPSEIRNTEQAGIIRAHPPAVLTPANWLPIMPFRWVEVENWVGELTVDQISRRAAYATNWNDKAASFECSDPTLTKIWDLCQYSIKATTFAGVYVDGDRERIPYEADAYLNQLSHYYTDDKVEMAARTFDWLMDNGTWPSEWAPHMVFMGHAQWMYSGDLQWLKHRYESLKAKTLISRTAEDGLVRSAEIDQKRTDIVDWPQKERDGFVFTEINNVVNAFHIEALRRMGEMAAAIGNDDDAAAFDARVKLATASFQEKLFDESAGIYRDGIGTDHSSFHANFFPLAFGIVPDDKVDGVVQWLRKQDMNCSVYAAQYLMEALFRHQADDRAIELMLADGDRSWKHMLESGTTISWEAWDQKYKPNQDWNHAWGAAPGNLLPRFVLGVEAATPGWQVASIRPMTASLSHASGKVPTSRGPIKVEWTNESSFKLKVDLPKAISAKIDVPAAEGSTGVLLNGEKVDAKRVNDRWVLSDTVTGSFDIQVQ